MTILNLFLSALPLLALCLTVAAFCASGKDRKRRFQGIVEGACVWSLAVFLSANGLGFLNLLTATAIYSFWLVYIFFCIFIIIRFRLHPAFELPREGIYSLIYLLCGLTFIFAIVYPPNNWDILAYHLPRVMEWLQNHNLAPFYTNVPRQIGMPPFNSLVALQILAAGTDRLVNLPQWFAYVASICASVQIADELKASPRARVWTALIMATLPGALMQATIMEATNIVTFWLLAFVWTFLHWHRQASWHNSLLMSLCLGFAILTKGTSYPVAFPFVLIIAWQCLRCFKARFLQGILMAALIIIINVPHYLRVYEASDGFFSGAEKNILEKPGSAIFAVNSLYNFLANESLLLKWGGRKAGQELAAQLGIKDSDSHYFPWGGLDEMPSSTSYNDGYGQNPIGAIFLLALLLAVCFRKYRPPALYFSLLCAAFASYSLFLAWHPWTARLQLPLFALAAPVCGLYMASWKSRNIQKLMAIVFGFYAILVLCLGDRPVSGLFNAPRNFAFHNREELYIPYLPVRDAYLEAISFLAAQAPESLGIHAIDDNLEYPLWILLKEKNGVIPHIVHMKNLNVAKDSPAWVWVQEKGASRPLAPPRILKKTGEEYIQVFPVITDM